MLSVIVKSSSATSKFLLLCSAPLMYWTITRVIITIRINTRPTMNPIMNQILFPLFFLFSTLSVLVLLVLVAEPFPSLLLELPEVAEVELALLDPEVEVFDPELSGGGVTGL